MKLDSLVWQFFFMQDDPLWQEFMVSHREKDKFHVVQNHIFNQCWNKRHFLSIRWSEYKENDFPSKKKGEKLPSLIYFKPNCLKGASACDLRMLATVQTNHVICLGHETPASLKHSQSQCVHINMQNFFQVCFIYYCFL